MIHQSFSFKGELSPVIRNLVVEEGFGHTPYPDPLTHAEPYTFGHGLTYISVNESFMLMSNRLVMIEEQLSQALKYFDSLPLECKYILMDMAYQLGVDGLLKFKQTLIFISKGLFAQAAVEMLDSKWAISDTPKRAKALSIRMSKIK